MFTQTEFASCLALLVKPSPMLDLGPLELMLIREGGMPIKSIDWGLVVVVLILPVETCLAEFVEYLQ